MRPKKPESEKRDKEIKVRCKESDYNTFHKKAEKMRLPAATLAHDILIKGINHIKIPLPITDEEVMKKVIQYGNNLNQIAKSMNALNKAHRSELPEDIPYLATKIEGLMSSVDSLTSFLISRNNQVNDRES